MSAKPRRPPQPAYRQSRAEVLDHLRDQFEFLVASCSAYDALKFSESKRIAVVVRTLLHDTDRSVSLFEQIRLKTPMTFEDTCGPLARNLVLHFGALAAPSTSRAWGSYVPLYERRFAPHGLRTPKPFHDWWTEPVLKDQSERTFNRRTLVLALCNKDGGTHVDPKLDDAYAALSRGNAMGIKQAASLNDEGVDLGSPVPASVRQIGHEVVRSCQWWLPAVLADVGVDDIATTHVVDPLRAYGSPFDATGYRGAMESPPP